ncbi:hypothetical protein [Yeosuana marina]|uniref:hypothetical protein n=1 Tax=Yeosuana marina TaxID=1565536 RepID=UPI0030C85A0B
MAPLKFEEHIKDKLEERSIQPSADAWNKLDTRLGKPVKQSKNKPLVWIGVAASIVGVLLVGSRLFNENKTEIIAPTIVATPEVEKQEESTKVGVKKEDEINEVEIAKQQDSELQSKKVIVKTKANQITKDQQLASTKEGITNKSSNSGQARVKSFEIKKKKLSFEDEKIQELVAQVQNLKDKNKTVTDSEIDALLEQAQNEIRLQKEIYNNATGIVDAKALLSEVEQELDESFRDKAFKALKENFDFIKTAIANRNN